jgi:hypothetical protein
MWVFFYPQYSPDRSTSVDTTEVGMGMAPDPGDTIVFLKDWVCKGVLGKVIYSFRKGDEITVTDVKMPSIYITSRELAKEHKNPTITVADWLYLTQKDKAAVKLKVGDTFAFKRPIQFGRAFPFQRGDTGVVTQVKPRVINFTTDKYPDLPFALQVEDWEEGNVYKRAGVVGRVADRYLRGISR